MEGMNAHHSHDVPTAVAPTADPPTADLAAVLRARGMRVTAQREQVLAAVRQLRHATPDQISDAVTGVDVATVYRTLELLEQLGLVRHAHLGHGSPSYRPAEDEHIHVVCHACGSVVDAEPTLVEALAERLIADSGFVLDRSHFTVFGRCHECAQPRVAEQNSGATR